MSSELQEIIASQAIRAFNQGLNHGTKSERDRIIRLLEENVAKWIPNGRITSANIIELITEDQND